MPAPFAISDPKQSQHLPITLISGGGDTVKIDVTENAEAHSRSFWQVLGDRVEELARDKGLASALSLDRKVVDFNDEEHPAPIIVTDVRISAPALNLQRCCSDVVFLDVPANASNALQAVGRSAESDKSARIIYGSLPPILHMITSCRRPLPTHDRCQLFITPAITCAPSQDACDIALTPIDSLKYDPRSLSKDDRPTMLMGQ